MAATRLFDLPAVFQIAIRVDYIKRTFAGLGTDPAGKNRKNSNGTQMPPSNSAPLKKRLCSSLVPTYRHECRTCDIIPLWKCSALRWMNC